MRPSVEAVLYGFTELIVESKLVVGRRILIVNRDEELRSTFFGSLSSLGHQVLCLSDATETLDVTDLEEFDLIVSDLSAEHRTRNDIANEDYASLLFSSTVPSDDDVESTGDFKAFKLNARNFRPLPSGERDLADIFKSIVTAKLEVDAKHAPKSGSHERIEFELPSDLALMEIFLEYIAGSVSRIWAVEKPECASLLVALDEAFVNAVRHGNEGNPRKMVRISADLSSEEARFTFEDQGKGFDVENLPPPREPANRLKSSGRGVLLIRTVMDKVEYSERGTRLTMVKRAPSLGP